MNRHDYPEQNKMGWVQSRMATWVFLGFLAIGAFFLITEHTAHLLGILPFAIFLLCPVMMLFMHHGHAGHGEHDQPHGEADRRTYEQHTGHEEHPSEGEQP